MSRWDVIVIGAGPAGSSAALAAARAGSRVLMLERRRHVGLPVQCAEYVPQALAGEASVPAAAVAQRVDLLRTYIEGRPAAENRWPGLILNRAVFDQHLAREAVAAGATLRTGCRVEAVEENAVVLGEGERHEAEAIVGADGPRSVTARAMGVAPASFVYGLQVEAELAEPLGHTEAHFRPEFTGGYGWVFPKGRTANVGVGVALGAARTLARLLEAFLAELRDKGVLRDAQAGKRTGGLIPVGGPPERTAAGSRLLAGDAAGQTDPITGGGIPAAILCGKMAGEALCAGRPRDYEEAWRDLLGPGLRRALGRRSEQCREWNQGRFDKLIRRTWIAFPEYYDAH